VLAVLSASAAAPDLVQLAREKPAEAVNAALALPPELRRETLRQLLGQADMRALGAGLTVMERALDSTLTNDLQKCLAKGGARLPRTRIENLLKEIALYQPIAIAEAPQFAAPPAPGPASPAPSETARRFRPVSVKVRVQRTDGAPAEGVGVRVFSDDFGVSVPLGSWARPGPDGLFNLALFPGHWTFFAAGAREAGQGLYLCRPGTEVVADGEMVLRADRTLTLAFPDLAAGQEMDEVQVSDSAFSAYLPAGRLGKTAKGVLRLLTGPGRPLDVIAVRQPVGGAGLVLFANHVQADAAGRLAVRGGQAMATLQFAPAAGAAALSKARVDLRIHSLQRPEVTLTGAPPFQVAISTGLVEVAYGWETARQEALDFHARGYPLAAGERRPFSLGEPYASSIFHQFYRSFQHATNMTAYYLFVTDANGHILERYRPAARSGAAPAIPVEVWRAGKMIFNSSAPGKLRARQFVSEMEGLSPAVNLDAELEYRVRLPFTGETSPRLLKGHGQDAEVNSRHFRFKGPREVAYSATNWIQGAELTYAAMSRLLGQETRKREQGAAQGISINAMMPVGVGAFASGGNTTFPVGSALELTRPLRVLKVPFSHELLHTFAHGHKDYMSLTCRETAVTLFQGSPAARALGGSAENDEFLRALQGKVALNHSQLLGPMLMESFGYTNFLRYFAEGRPRREQLWAAGLTELETDCALFDSFTGGRARAIFHSLGVPLRPDMVERGLALLKAAPSEAEARAAAAARREVGATLRRLRESLARNDPAAGQLATALRKNLEPINDQRYVADMYAVAGELYFKNGAKLPAYEMLKDCQRAALKVSPSFFLNARSTCLKILKGEAIRTLQ